MKKSLIIALILSAVGVYASTELIEVSASQAAGAEIPCGSENKGCAEAAKSDYAELFGTPISVFGMSFYLAAFLLALASLFWRSEQEQLLRTLFIGSVAAVGYSIFLATVSLMGGYLCPYCAVLYGVNLGLFITAFVALPNRKEGGFGQLASVPKSIAFWAAALLLFAAFPTSKYLYVMSASAKKQQVLAEQAERDKNILKPEQLKSQLASKGENETDSKREGKTNSGQAANANEADVTKAGQDGPSGAPVMPNPIAFETKERPTRGNTDTPITVVEFADFQCGYCQRFGNSLKTALKSAPGKFNYVFKHFPLDSKCNPGIEPGGQARVSCEAAYAMVCAGQSGKEWEMHDLIFDNQRALNGNSFTLFAQELGLPLNPFKACMSSPDTKRIVTDDVMEGIKAGIQGTPSVFVNGLQMAPELDGTKLGALLSTLSDQMK